MRILGMAIFFETYGPTIDAPLLVENMALILAQIDPPEYVILNIDEGQAFGDKEVGDKEEGVVIYNGQEFPVKKFCLG